MEKTLIENLCFNDYNDLVDELNRNLAWKIIAEYMVNTVHAFSTSWIAALKRRASIPNGRESPGGLLLKEIQNKMYSVEIFSIWLEQCELFDALYILRGRDLLVIDKQLSSHSHETPFEVLIGETFSITCKAKGLPPPKFQWMHGNTDLQDEISSTLNIKITNHNQEGEYRCRVSQYDRNEELLDTEYSARAVLKITPMPVKIIKQPASVKVKLNASITLSCEATGHPMPKYQWWKGNTELPGETSCSLMISQFEREKEGEYYCVVSSDISRVCTDASKVTVDYPRQNATAKVALLIANGEYHTQEKLAKAKTDAETLAKHLEKMDFSVFMFTNLTLGEMTKVIQQFSKHMKKGVYGVFYFVGHGFSIHDCYMMPVDVPQMYVKADTISESELLAPALKKNPALLVVILDMCQTLPSQEKNPRIYEEKVKVIPYKINGNLFQAYSTCRYSACYESINDDNGVYMSYLAKCIEKPKPVPKIFEDVSNLLKVSMKKITEDQKPMTINNLAIPYRYLTDTIVLNTSSKRRNVT